MGAPLVEGDWNAMSLRPLVMKFGGTSVGDATAFERVRRIVRARESEHPVVVVSAMGGFTDALLEAVEAAHKGDPDAAARSLDQGAQEPRSDPPGRTSPVGGDAVSAAGGSGAPRPR